MAAQVGSFWVAVNENERAWKQAKGKLSVSAQDERRMIEYLKYFSGEYPEVLRKVWRFSQKAFAHLKFIAGQEVYSSNKWANA